MVNRYEVATLFKENWPLLIWKGDEHTEGIYFTEKYGYLVESSYCVRMEHNEDSPPVFFVPTNQEDEDDEVLLTFPYQNMTKRPNKYQLLFQKNELTKDEIENLFDWEDAEHICTLSVQPLIELLSSVTKKRERDRMWLVIKSSSSYLEIYLMKKTNNTFSIFKKMVRKKRCNEKSDVVYITLNSNVFLHTLNLFSLDCSVSISKTSDRIIITSDTLKDRIEALIATPKPSIQREIERSLDTS